MIPYVMVFLLASAVAILSLDHRAKVHLLIPVAAASLVVFVGIRYESVDYQNYEGIFNYVDDPKELSIPNYVPSSGEKPTEAVYSLLILAVKMLGGGYYVFIFIIALLSIGIKVYAFKKMSNSFYLSLLLYVAVYMTNDLGQIRNGLSSALVLLSILYLAHGKWRVHLGLVALASLVHITAVMAFAASAMRFFSRTWVLYGAICIGMAVAAVGGAGLFVTELIMKTFGLGGEFRLVRYMTSQYAEPYSIFGGTVMLHTATALGCIALRRRLTVINPYNAYFIPLYVFGTALMLFVVDYGIILARLKDLFCLPASMIIIPSFVYIVRPNARIVAALGVAAYASVMLVLYMPAAEYRTILTGAEF